MTLAIVSRFSSAKGSALCSSTYFPSHGYLLVIHLLVPNNENADKSASSMIRRRDITIANELRSSIYWDCYQYYMFRQELHKSYRYQCIFGARATNRDKKRESMRLCHKNLLECSAVFIYLLAKRFHRFI